MFKKGKYVYEGYFKNGKFEGKGDKFYIDLIVS